jgi:methyl-accepting chemotaxis protein
MSNRNFWLLTLCGMAVITLLLGWTANRYAIERKVEAASERLSLLGTLRRDALERYFDTARAELRFWSTNPELVQEQAWAVSAWEQVEASGRDARQLLREAYVESNPYPPGQRYMYDDAPTETRYGQFHSKLNRMAKQFVLERGYYDLFLISPAGNIHYSVTKELDFATNLVSGEYRDTGLGRVFQRLLQLGASDEWLLSDMAAYPPSNNEPALFLAEPMYSPDGEFIGAIALQLPTERLHEIMKFDAGMGETGETYLVGQDFMMRSESRFSEESAVLKTRVESDTVTRALRGEYGVDFTTDYRGVRVLSAFSSINLGETSWAVMAEIDEQEIYRAATSEQPLLAGLMLFLYSLGIWSAWFIQRAEGDIDGGSMLADLDAGLDLPDN